MNMYLNDPSNPIYSASKGKLKREQFEKLKGKNWKGTWVFLSISKIFKDHLFPLPPAGIASRLFLSSRQSCLKNLYWWYGHNHANDHFDNVGVILLGKHSRVDSTTRLCVVHILGYSWFDWRHNYKTSKSLKIDQLQHTFIWKDVSSEWKYKTS